MSAFAVLGSVFVWVHMGLKFLYVWEVSLTMSTKSFWRGRVRRHDRSCLIRYFFPLDVYSCVSELLTLICNPLSQTYHLRLLE